jgi:hypothetical protein
VRTRSIPVIMVTALNSDAQVSACLDDGAVDHICRPFSSVVVRARVRAALRSRALAGEDNLPGAKQGKVFGLGSGRRIGWNCAGATHFRRLNDGGRRRTERLALSAGCHDSPRARFARASPAIGFPAGALPSRFHQCGRADGVGRSSRCGTRIVLDVLMPSGKSWPWVSCLRIDFVSPLPGLFEVHTPIRNTPHQRVIKNNLTIHNHKTT